MTEKQKYAQFLEYGQWLANNNPTFLDMINKIAQDESAPTIEEKIHLALRLGVLIEALDQSSMLN